jgi:hypothetical protein
LWKAIRQAFGPLTGGCVDAGLCTASMRRYAPPVGKPGGMSVKTAAFFAAAVLLAVVGARGAPDGGRIVIPRSGVEQPGDVGQRGHTNVEIFVPRPGTGPPPRSPAPPGIGPAKNPHPGPQSEPSPQAPSPQARP